MITSMNKPQGPDLTQDPIGIATRADYPPLEEKVTYPLGCTITTEGMEGEEENVPHTTALSEEPAVIGFQPRRIKVMPRLYRPNMPFVGHVPTNWFPPRPTVAHRRDAAYQSVIPALIEEAIIQETVYYGPDYLTWDENSESEGYDWDIPVAVLNATQHALHGNQDRRTTDAWNARLGTNASIPINETKRVEEIDWDSYSKEDLLAIMRDQQRQLNAVAIQHEVGFVNAIQEALQGHNARVAETLDQLEHQDITLLQAVDILDGCNASYVSAMALARNKAVHALNGNGKEEKGRDGPLLDPEQVMPRLKFRTASEENEYGARVACALEELRNKMSNIKRLRKEKRSATQKKDLADAITSYRRECEMWQNHAGKWAGLSTGEKCQCDARGVYQPHPKFEVRPRVLKYYDTNKTDDKGFWWGTDLVLTWDEYNNLVPAVVEELRQEHYLEFHPTRAKPVKTTRSARPHEVTDSGTDDAVDAKDYYVDEDVPFSAPIKVDFSAKQIVTPISAHEAPTVEPCVVSTVPEFTLVTDPIHLVSLETFQHNMPSIEQLRDEVKGEAKAESPSDGADGAGEPDPIVPSNLGGVEAAGDDDPTGGVVTPGELKECLDKIAKTVNDEPRTTNDIVPLPRFGGVHNGRNTQIVINHLKLHSGANFMFNEHRYGVEARATIDIGGASHYFYGMYPKYDGVTEVVFSDALGHFLWVVGHDDLAEGAHPNPMYRGHRLGDPYQRAWDACCTFISTQSWKRSTDWTQLKNRARAHYTRFYGPFYNLDRVCDLIVQSDLFLRVCQHHVTTETKKELMRQKLQIEWALGVKELKTFKEAWVSVVHQISFFQGLQYAWCWMATAGTPEWIGIRNEFAIKAQRDFLHKWQKKLLPKVEVVLVPANRVFLKTYTVPKEDIPQHQLWGGVCTNSSPEHTVVDEEKKVEIYGATIDAPMCVPTNNNQNLEAAIAMRLGQYVGEQKGAAADFYAHAKPKMDAYDQIDVACTDAEAMTHFKSHYGRKKAIRLMELRKKPLKPGDFTRIMFTKMEPYPKENKDMGPRVIIGAEEVVVAHYGPEMAKMSKALAKKHHEGTDLFYATSTTPHKLGSAIQDLFDKYSHVYMGDGKHWDGSLGPTIGRLEREFLRDKIIGLNPEDHAMLVQYWVELFGVSKDRLLMFQKLCGRKSGDGPTACFNTVSDGLYIDWAVEQLHIKKVCLGDDIVFAVDDEIDEGRVIQKYASMGMVYKLKKVDNPVFLEFCSGWAIRVGKRRKWCNKWAKVLQKMGLDLTNHHPKYHRRFLLGTAKSHLPALNHCPVIRVILWVIIRELEALGLKPLYDNRALNPYRPQGGVVDDCTQESLDDFAERYETTVDYVLDLEESLWKLTINDFPLVFRDPFFIRALEIDVGRDFHGAPNSNLIIHNANAHYDSLVAAPIREEKEKLTKGGLWSCVKYAYEWGKDEDDMAGTSSHKWLHVAFTLTSFFNLTAGIALHAAYNRLALRANGVVCNKKKVVSRKARPQPVGPPKRERRIRDRGPGNVPRMSGMGKYNLGDLWHGIQSVGRRFIPPGFFHAAGTHIGNLISPGAGGIVGGAAGSIASKVFGFGAYHTAVRSNSLLGTNPLTRRGQTPTFVTRGDGTELMHAEFVFNVPATGSTTFTTYTFALNPGLYLSAPWMSGIAPAFDTYFLAGMVVTLTSTYSDITSGGALGAMAMVFDPDCLDGAYPNMIEVLNAEGSTSAKPSLDQMMFIECDPRMTQFPIKTVRSGPIPSNADQRAYDHGNLVVCTEGLATSTGIVAQLKIVWHVIFYKPQLTLPPATVQDHFALSTSVSSSHYMGADTTTVSKPTATSTLGGTIKNSTYTFPTTVRIGDIYSVAYSVTGASTTLTTTLGTTLTGCTAANLYSGDSNSDVAVASGAVTVTQMITQTITVTSTTCTFAIASGTLPGTISGGDLWVSRIASTT